MNVQNDNVGLIIALNEEESIKEIEKMVTEGKAKEILDWWKADVESIDGMSNNVIKHLQDKCKMDVKTANIKGIISGVLSGVTVGFIGGIGLLAYLELKDIERREQKTQRNEESKKA